MSKKLYDICAKTGSYTTREGETKNRYQNVGAVIQGDNGPFIILERWFNPAGVPTDRDSVLLSLLKADDKPRNEPKREEPPAFDDDPIPF